MLEFGAPLPPPSRTSIPRNKSAGELNQAACDAEAKRGLQVILGLDWMVPTSIGASERYRSIASISVWVPRSVIV